MRFPAWCLPLFLACSSGAQEFHHNIPKAWDDKDVEGFEVPLAQGDRSPRYMSSTEYYKLQVRRIYRSYPAYAKGMEPPGYRDWLKQQEPQIVFDPAKLRTTEDWIAAGKIVFEAEIQFFPALGQPAPAEVPFPGADKNGVLPSYRPGFRYIIRKKGVVEAGINACVGCHIRPLPDGTWIEGAQGIVDTPPTAAGIQRQRDVTPDAYQRRL